MDEQIQFNPTEEKHDWFNNHVLTKEQVAQLIQDKFDRARINHEATKKVNRLTYTD
jgi:Spy/CpxP family protein refolding chaperone